MKNNELNNKENKNFEEGFGMSNEEMNQIVGGSSFLMEADLYASYVAEPAFGSFGEAMTGDNAMACVICQDTFVVVNTGCQTKKK